MVALLVFWLPREGERVSRWKGTGAKDKKKGRKSGEYASSFKVFAAPEPGLGLSFSPVPWSSFFLDLSFWAAYSLYIVRSTERPLQRKETQAIEVDYLHHHKGSEVRCIQPYTHYEKEKERERAKE